MKIASKIIRNIANTFLLPATPFFNGLNFMGSKQRIDAKEGMADSLATIASQTQNEIGKTKIENPFESAGAKSAMATASRKAKQVQQRFSNMLGANNNPEALVAAQGATQDAIAGSAGDIAVGSAAQKEAKLESLRKERNSQIGMAAQARQAAIDEYGSGQKDAVKTFWK